MESCLVQDNAVGARGGDGVRIGFVNNASLSYFNGRGNKRHGVRVDAGSRDVRMEHCRIEKSGRAPRSGCGLSVSGCARNVNVFGGSIEEAFDAGVCVEWATKVFLDAVRITNTQGALCVGEGEGADVMVEDGYCRTRAGVFPGAGPMKN